MSNCPERVREATVASAVGRLLPFTTFSASPTWERSSLHSFDLTRSSQETDSLFPNTQPRLALAIYYTHIGLIFPREATEHRAFKSLKNGGERRKGKQEVSVCAFSVQQRRCQELNRVFSYLILQCGGGDFRNGKTVAQNAQVSCPGSQRV